MLGPAFKDMGPTKALAYTSNVNVQSGGWSFCHEFL